MTYIICTYFAQPSIPRINVQIGDKLVTIYVQCPRWKVGVSNSHVRERSLCAVTVQQLMFLFLLFVCFNSN